jgi:hypothetical protein
MPLTNRLGSYEGRLTIARISPVRGSTPPRCPPVHRTPPPSPAAGRCRSTAAGRCPASPARCPAHARCVRPRWFPAAGSRLAAQLRFVIALQPGLAGMRVGAAGIAQRGLVLFVDPADVADDVREQRALRIHPAEVGHQLDAGEAPAVHGEARGFLVGHAQLDGHRLERPAVAVVAQEARALLGVQRHDRLQLGQQGFAVAGAFRHRIEPPRRHVVGQQPALAVVDQAARGRHRHQAQPVGLRAGGELGVLDHLQAEVPRRQAAQCRQHQQEADQRAAAEQVGFDRMVLELAGATDHRRAFNPAGAGAGYPGRSAAAPTAAGPAAAPASTAMAIAARPSPRGWRR